MKRNSLSTQITFWTGLIIVITAAGVVGYSAISLRSSVLEVAKENIHSISHQEGGHVNEYFHNAINRLQSMAQILGQVRDQQSPLDIPRYEAMGLVKNIAVQNTNFNSAFVCWEPEEYDSLDVGYAGEPGHDASGRFAVLWAKSDKGLGLSPLLESTDHSVDGQPGAWYSNPMSTGKPFISNVYYSKKFKALVSTVTVPVLHNDIFYGVVGIDLRLDILQKKLMDFDHFRKTMDAALIDNLGTVVASINQPEMIGGSMEYLYRDDLYLIPHIQSGAHFSKIENDHLYHIYEIDFAVGSPNWMMTAIVPISVFTSDISILIWKQITIFIGILVVMFFLTQRGAHIIINRPLTFLLEEINRVSKGDLNHELKMARNDEIGMIGEAFNAMRVKLKKVLLTLRNHQEELEQKVERRTTALQMKNKLIEKSRMRLQKALDEISALISQVMEQGGSLDASFTNQNLKKCWEVLKCDEVKCPCFGKEALRCWQENGTYCHGEEQGAFTDKIAMCQTCSVYKNTITDPIYQIGEHFNNMLFILKQNINKLDHANQQLFQAQKLESVGQLAAGIAHEINTPAQYVGSNIEFLQEAFEDVGELVGKLMVLLDAAKNNTISPALITELEETLEEVDWQYLSEEIPQTISQSKEGVQRVSKIVRAMKEFSHPGSKDKELANLNHIIETTMIVAGNEWKYVANVETDLQPDLRSVPCYSDQMGQVILNILVNGAHAIAAKLGDNPEGEKGVISISTRADDDWVEMRIADTGNGIPEEARDKIFDSFFTTKTVGKGTGQGLAIAHDVIVQKHGGTITFETESWKGTTFIVRIPLKARKNSNE